MKKLIICLMSLLLLTMVEQADAQGRSEEAKAKKEQAKEKGKGKKEEAQAKGKDKAEQAKAKGKEKADEAKEQAKAKGNEARDEAEGKAEDRELTIPGARARSEGTLRDPGLLPCRPCESHRFAGAPRRSPDPPPCSAS